MDDKTMQALTTLAEKLGTTAEYLWGVLLRQAPISGAIDLISIALLIACCAGWTQVVRHRTKVSDATKENPYPRAIWTEDMAHFLGWFTVGLSIVFTLIWVVALLPTAAAALLNPEYWALKQILK